MFGVSSGCQCVGHFWSKISKQKPVPLSLSPPEFDQSLFRGNAGLGQDILNSILSRLKISISRRLGKFQRFSSQLPRRKLSKSAQSYKFPFWSLSRSLIYVTRKRLTCNLSPFTHFLIFNCPGQRLSRDYREGVQRIYEEFTPIFGAGMINFGLNVKILQFRSDFFIFLVPYSIWNSRSLVAWSLSPSVCMYVCLSPPSCPSTVLTRC